MKIALGSDLHLEFGTFTPVNTDNADVLILSGDICIAEDMYRWPVDRAGIYEPRSRNKENALNYRVFFAECSKLFKEVIMVAGNHEFYHGKIKTSLETLWAETGQYDNFHFLENGSVKVDDVLFVGAALWTDMNKFDPTTLWACGDAMNDYRQITNDIDNMFRRLKPADTVEFHKETLKYFAKTIDAAPVDQKVVVVGHHAPSKVSTKPQYEKDFHINGAYSSDLSEFILDRPKIKVWTHGHTHSEFDYMIGSTRILANPRGYVGYERATHEVDPYNFKTFEV